MGSSSITLKKFLTWSQKGSANRSFRGGGSEEEAIGCVWRHSSYGGEDGDLFGFRGRGDIQGGWNQGGAASIARASESELCRAVVREIAGRKKKNQSPP